ncbi:MAG: peroxiredoxin [Patescibacteria group bacterium]
MMPRIGKPAPAFSLEGLAPDGSFKTYSLADYKGKWVVFFFYPLDFTFVCPTEIQAFSSQLDEFTKLGAEVLGCSTDSCFSHKAWTEGKLGVLRYPLLSDLARAVSASYGVLIPEKGHTLRGTFIIDPEGNLRYALAHDNNVGRSVPEILRALSALQTGELCPVNWKPGEATLGKG